jgi:hypothetical protein
MKRIRRTVLKGGGRTSANETGGYVERFVLRVGVSVRVAREFGLSRETVRKMLAYAVPPGHQRQQPIRRPKLGCWATAAQAKRTSPWLSVRLPASQRGHRVRFTTAAAMVSELIEARDERKLLRRAIAFGVLLPELVHLSAAIAST